VRFCLYILLGDLPVQEYFVCMCVCVCDFLDFLGVFCLDLFCVILSAILSAILFNFATVPASTNV